MVAELPVIIGETRFLQLTAETTWGVVPVSPTWINLPVTDYGVTNKPKRRNGQARIGSYQRKYGANSSAALAGNLVTPLYGSHPAGLATSLAQYLMEWGYLDQEVKSPRSKSAQWEYVAHEDDKGHTGLRVNQATLTGSESGISLTLDLIGQHAVNFIGAAAPPATRNKLVEFMFEDSLCTLNGANIPMSSFTWSVQRTLDPIYLNSTFPQALPKVSWSETFSVTPLKADASWDAKRDALGMQECAGNLTLIGLHNGTGAGGSNYTQVSIDFARLSLIDSTESGGISALMNPLTFDVLRTDASFANGSVMTWTDV